MENIGEDFFICLDVWCCLFLLRLFDFMYPIEWIIVVRVGRREVPSNYLHFHNLGPGEDPEPAEIMSRRRRGKYHQCIHKLKNSQSVINTFNCGFGRINPQQVSSLHFCWRWQDLFRDKQVGVLSVWRMQSRAAPGNGLTRREGSRERAGAVWCTQTGMQVSVGSFQWSNTLKKWVHLK